MPVLPAKKAFVEEWLRFNGDVDGFDLILTRADDESVEDEEAKSEASSDSSDSDSQDSDDNAVDAVIPSQTTDTATLPSVSQTATESPSTLPSSTSNPIPVGGSAAPAGKANTGPIVAAVVSSLIGAALLALFLYVWMVKRRRAIKRASFSAYTFNTPQPPAPAPQYAPSINVQAPSISPSQNPEMRESYYDKFPRSPSFIQEPPPVAASSLTRKLSKWSDRLSMGGKSFAPSENTRGGRMVEFPSNRF